MAPYFSQPDVKSFTDVTVTDEGVDTQEFLKAAEGVVGIFARLDSVVLNQVSSDLTGNITKVRARYTEAPEKSATLEKLVEAEVAEKPKPKQQKATEGLLWLLRGLALTNGALESTQANSAMELSTAFQGSYEKNLKQHHNFVTKALFGTMMGQVPSRATLYEKLKEDSAGTTAATQEELDEALNKWLVGLSAILTRMDKFYETKGYKKNF